MSIPRHLDLIYIASVLTAEVWKILYEILMIHNF